MPGSSERGIVSRAHMMPHSLQASMVELYGKTTVFIAFRKYHHNTIPSLSDMRRLSIARSHMRIEQCTRACSVVMKSRQYVSAIHDHSLIGKVKVTASFARSRVSAGFHCQQVFRRCGSAAETDVDRAVQCPSVMPCLDMPSWKSMKHPVIW
ncbi:hypothetical protein BDV97DRAFT_102323 [Delphinella strobiligena]|nr:hypothetical protein BDV97DRAFT_102323 [Delphinella strobiligena]